MKNVVSTRQLISCYRSSKNMCSVRIYCAVAVILCSSVHVGCQLLTLQNMPRWGTPKDQINVGSGDGLLLTEHIESGNDALARKLARVDKTLFLDVISYAGFFTVNQEFNSNLFFWFFPAVGTEHLYEDDQAVTDNGNDSYDYNEDNEEIDNEKRTGKKKSKPDWENENKPVVLWLQGGPGSSSLFGLFTENGPFFVNDDKISIRKNPYSWHQNYSLIFIDQPVGTGFSFTNTGGLCTNISQVSDQLYTGLVQFFKMFPWLQSNDFFITGESFAGKYIPGIGHTIMERNMDADLKINLQGLALGNALSDPFNMLNYAEFAYQTGLVDTHGWRLMKLFEHLAKEFWPSVQAKIYWDTILYTFIINSNYTNLYNILEPKALDLDPFREFIELSHIRNSIHVGKQPFKSPEKVYISLIPDFMNTAIHWTEKLLDAGMRVMYYSGNMDFIVAYPLSENAYKKMNWKGFETYRVAKRKPFIVNGKLVGYTKKADNFIDAVILNAGHMVPTDQPIAAFELIDQFIKNTL